MSKYGENMLLVNSAWQGKKTFGLMPLTADCPYNEAILDPETLHLVIFMKNTKEAYHMVSKLDDYGEPIQDKSRPGRYKQQRVKLETFSEHVLYDKKDIESFISNFAVNHKDFDYNSFLAEKNIVKEEKKPQIITE